MRTQFQNILNNAKAPNFTEDLYISEKKLLTLIYIGHFLKTFLFLILPSFIYVHLHYTDIKQCIFYTFMYSAYNIYTFAIDYVV